MIDKLLSALRAGHRYGWNRERNAELSVAALNAEPELRALCAKARGLQLHKRLPTDTWHEYLLNGKFYCWENEYNPLDDANQADDLLEHVARKLNCSWSLIYHVHLGRYECWLHRTDYGAYTTAETQNLAKILCSLRASPEVTDAEINDAMEEKK